MFIEIFAVFAFKWVENVTLNSAISFINLLYDRTTKFVAKRIIGKN